MVKLLIDTDPGVDDAMAIFYAAADPAIDLVGLTTICGNVPTPMATRNALRLVEAAGLAIPVAEGAHAPQTIPMFEPAHFVHGDEGFGNMPAETPRGQAIDEPAAEFLVRMAREHKGELVLCPVGPLTNIAAAIRLDPDFATNCKRMVVMGGSLRAGGNITPHAEANIYHDPHAADEVLASGAEILMIGLDVTDRILCSRGDFRDLAGKAPRLGGMLAEMSDFYMDFYLDVRGLDGCALHDPAAVIACVAPELFTTERVGVAVDLAGETIGRTVEVSDGSRAPFAVALDADLEAVRRRFLDTVATLP